MVVVAQPFSDVTWRVRSGQGFSGKTASVLPACTICTSMSSEPRSMLKALTPRRPHPVGFTGRRRHEVSAEQGCGAPSRTWRAS